jgi:DNA polymerase
VALADDDNPAVQALVGARLGHKSTLEETRTERLLKVSRLWWPEQGNASLMPIPLRFSGAHTHRLSGDWKLNLQNLPRNNRIRKSPLRRALMAEPGHEVVAGDMAQIEARIVAWLCGQAELVGDFAAGKDVYSSFASTVFGVPVNRKLDDPDQIGMGFVGKKGVLGLGFGVGWPKFQSTVKTDSRTELGRVISLTDQVSQGVIHTYRVVKYPEIPAGWNVLKELGIPALADGHAFDYGPTQFERGAVLLPSGLRLKYHDLQYNRPDWDGWSYVYGGKTKRLYGGAFMENIVQALARIITMDAAVRIQRRIYELGLWLNLQAHDELVYIVPTELVSTIKTILLEEMAKPVSWAPGLPLKAEVGSGPTYADAK